MNLEQTQTDIQNANEKPPFNVGDLVMMRNKDLKLKMYKNHKPNDIGLVLAVNKTKSIRRRKYQCIPVDKWYITVMWQQYAGHRYNYNYDANFGKDTTIMWYTRLKKVK